MRSIRVCGRGAEMLLEVVDLAIDMPTPRGPRRIVREISFSASAGESLGIVGESGSGKTMTALALIGLLPDGAVTAPGQSRLDLLGAEGASPVRHGHRGEVGAGLARRLHV